MIVVYSPHNNYKLLDSETGQTVSGSEETSSETEVPSDLIKEVQRTNDILSGIIFFLGLIFGAIGMSIFYSRWRKE